MTQADLYPQVLDREMAVCSDSLKPLSITSPEFAYWSGRLSALVDAKEFYLGIKGKTPLQPKGERLF